MLRLQKERMSGALLPSESEYFNCFGLTQEKLAFAKPDAIVMHPGPINRGIELAAEVADGPRSSILRQVANGLAVRMAAALAETENLRRGLRRGQTQDQPNQESKVFHCDVLDRPG